jgi:tetratricopeptide (TPR) repeat protein
MRLLIAAVLLLPTAALAGTWSDDYRRGLVALDAGRLPAARRALERAAREHPRPEAAARTYGARSVAYLPWLQLSVVAYREGRLEEAQAHLARSKAEGVAASIDEGRLLIDKQELLLESLRLARVASASPQPARSERDLEREKILARQVAAACGEPTTGRASGRPWYYHYLLARELAEHGDALGAVQHLARALGRRDEPSETARTYGMKVVSYRPYWELGRAHARLGNLGCAVDALELSRRLEDFGGSSELERRERELLLAATKERLKAEDGGGR